MQGRFRKIATLRQGQSHLAMTHSCIFPLLNQPTTNKCLAGKVLHFSDKQSISRLFYYSRVLSFVDGTYQPKTFRKGSEASSRAERGHGYVIFVSNEPSCYHAATSERRRIRLKADYYHIALRGASIRRSQRGNSEAVFFR